MVSKLNFRLFSGFNSNSITLRSQLGKPFFLCNLFLSLLKQHLMSSDLTTFIYKLSFKDLLCSPINWQINQSIYKFWTINICISGLNSPIVTRPLKTPPPSLPLIMFHLDSMFWLARHADMVPLLSLRWKENVLTSLIWN